MTRWRVDFRVKSDMVLAKHEKELVFTSPDNSYQIHLLTKRGLGQHAADELYLSAHVILEDDDCQTAADKAEVCLGRFLDVLTIVTNGYYRIKERTMVADWTPGLTKRRFLYYKEFPNPNIPVYALVGAHIESVKTLLTNPIPRLVRLAINWWAKGVSAEYPHEQFQFFWYALEILSEHAKPTEKVSTKCPTCNGDLSCSKCNHIPLHRPYPKQAIKSLVDKHVKGEPERFFQTIDDARNRLLHGDNPAEIETRLDIKWEHISYALGMATWAALLETLVRNASGTSTVKAETLAIMQASSYLHYQFTLTADMEMGAAHADPAIPQIEEFQPHAGLQINMNVQERQEKLKGEPVRPALED